MADETRVWCGCRGVGEHAELLGLEPLDSLNPAGVAGTGSVDTAGVWARFSGSSDDAADQTRAWIELPAPATLEAVLDAQLALGEATGRVGRARGNVVRLRERMFRAEESIPAWSDRPEVIVLLRSGGDADTDRKSVV